MKLPTLMKIATLLLLLFTTLYIPIESPTKIVFWPSIIALSLSILTRRPALSLAIGAFVGVVYLNLSKPERIPEEFIRTHFLEQIASPWNIGILLFTLTFGGFAGILQHGGGLTAIAERLLKKSTHSQRDVEQSAFLFGLVCFFDGLANSMLVGRLFRPLAERYQVSKARLAYIVDSTSSPIACLSVASTWIAYQMSMIQTGLETAELSLSPYLLYLKSWPFNFYCLFSLILLFATIRRQWLIGPMKSYQENKSAAKPEEAVSANSTTNPGILAMTAATSSLIVLLFSLLCGLFLDGCLRSPVGTPSIEIMAYAEASSVLVTVSILASAFAYIIHRTLLPEINRIHSLENAFWDGVAQMLRPLSVLLAAWILSSVLKELNTAGAISTILNTNLSPAMLPLGVFISACIVSFFTGTSWGTMGIITPLAIYVAIDMSPHIESDPTLLCSVIGAIFSGAVFGDHCSPLSDTTIVSAAACGVDPIDHVRTQIPYAMIAAIWASFFGFLAAGFGVNPWLCLLIAGVALYYLPAISLKLSRH